MRECPRPIHTGRAEPIGRESGGGGVDLDLQTREFIFRPRDHGRQILGQIGVEPTALAVLRRHGFDAVDTDEPGWTEWSDEEAGYVWREDRIAELLARARNVPLYVSGTVSNQGRFYRRFDAIVLLSAPADVLLGRIESRTTNDYGKTPDERDLILWHFAGVEPLLRATCTHEIDATQPIDDVVAELVAIGSQSHP